MINQYNIVITDCISSEEHSIIIKSDNVINAIKLACFDLDILLDNIEQISVEKIFS